MHRSTNKRVAFRVLLLLALLIGFPVHAQDWIYTVSKGDNLWNLTEDYLHDVSYVEKVRQLNNIEDPWHILPGTKIRIPGEWIRQYPAIARVMTLQGSATILEAGNDQSQPLAVGSIAMLGDVISTAADTSLVLGFLDGSRILIQENSQLKINRIMLLEYTGMSDVHLELKSGRVETLVAPKKGTARRFQIKTPATVTSVRGTDYRVSAEAQAQESRAEVVQGKVYVEGRRKTRQLTGGFGTLTRAGQEPLPPVKLLPPPDIGYVPEIFTRVPLQFTLPELEPEQSYRTQIARTDEFLDILYDKVTTNALIRGPDLADGAYSLRVRAIDANLIEGLNAQRRVNVNAKPEPPFLVEPKEGAGVLIEESPEFVWSKRENIDRYHFQFAADEEFQQLLIDLSDVADTSVTVSEQQPVGKYYWRVAAIDEDGDGPFSDGQLMRRILPAPELEAPEISDESLMIRSRKGLPGQRYHIQMAASEDFEDLILDQQAEEPIFEIPRPDGGEYYVRIRTIDPDGFVGPFGAVQTIDVPYDDLYLLLLLLPLFALFAL